MREERKKEVNARGGKKEKREESEERLNVINGRRKLDVKVRKWERN